MNTRELIDLSDKYIMQTYRRLPVVWREGAGVYLYDADGKKYLDLLGGIAVCALGHSHPKLVAAVVAQAAKLMHTSNLYHIEAQAICARMLVEKSFADRVFFCNSGAEANEAAIKLARKYGNTVLGSRNEIITTLQSFHGRTLATITATGQAKFQKGFKPLPTGFVYAKFNDIDSAASLITKKTCAIMVEPIQAEGGLIVPDADYLKALRQLCDKHGILLILDEVQTGAGRTGAMFAYQKCDMEPDIMTLAKALGGGFPVGAMLATQKIANAFEAGDHASTFGGNPLAMAAVAATLEIIETEYLLGNCAKMGKHFQSKLSRIKSKSPHIKDVRGQGLLIGVELDIEAAPIIMECLKRGVVIGSAGQNVLRLAPPLTIDVSEADAGLAALESALGG